jgi:hypothetical protein
MCVLQPIYNNLLVAFCYCHLPPPNRKEPTLQITQAASASGVADALLARSLPGEQDLS